MNNSVTNYSTLTYINLDSGGSSGRCRYQLVVVVILVVALVVVVEIVLVVVAMALILVV